MIPYEHQIDGSDEAYKILKANAIVYIAWEERCGKTLVSILVAEKSKATNVLILTKKKALEGWNETLSSFLKRRVRKTARGAGGDSARLYTGDTSYTVTNYHGAEKLKPIYDLVVLDEAHSYLSAHPKTGKIWRDVAVLTKGRPIIYMSATPYAQGYGLLYHQLKLSSWTPWITYKNFYAWHRAFGIPDKTRTPYGLVETYKKIDPVVWSHCSHLFITKTRKELDFEHEPTDIIKYVELTKSTRDLYNKIMSTEIFELGDLVSPMDSPMKLRTTLHMLEGGVAKIGDEYIILKNQEKIDAIKTEFGDTGDVVIMYQYIAEGNKLREHFKHATILQGTSFAEGVDLSGFKHLIIYSQDFSTARHSQRRARQANKKRDTPINVTFYLTKDGISDQVYTTVSINKTNFINSLFERKDLR